MEDKDYFFDTYAIIEIIRGNQKYEFVKNKQIITCVTNLAELFYSLLLENKEDIVDSIIENLNIKFLDITSNISLKAALFRYKNKSLSYIDCIGYIASINNNLIFLTGDKEFKNLNNVEFVAK